MAQVVRAAVAPLWQWQFKLFLSPQTTGTAVPHRLSFLAARSFRRHVHFRSHGLRLPRETDQGGSGGSHGGSDGVSDESAADKKKKSRNEMKREARVAVRWGMDLASFSTPQIKRILKAASLEQEVFEALMLVKRLGPDVREGKRRQFNYIGKLLRGAQPDLLGALIEATKDGDQSGFQALAGSTGLIDDDTEKEFYESESEEELEDSSEHLILANRWCDGLITKDIQISNEVYSVEDVEFDRQELRRLVRKVHNVQDRQDDNEDDTTGAELITAKKSLNLFLTSLAKRLLLSSSQNALI